MLYIPILKLLDCVFLLKSEFLVNNKCCIFSSSNGVIRHFVFQHPQFIDRIVTSLAIFPCMCTVLKVPVKYND